MMAREGKKKICVHCGDRTLFVRTFSGPRGAEHKEDCCQWCGESKARRDWFAENRRTK
jgi:hypothetical protein